jgi:hypothetical protein
MAAGDFSASVRYKAQAFLEDMFGDMTPAMNEFRTPAKTVELLMSRQTARTTPIMKGTVCVGQDIVWLKSGVTSVDYIGTTASGASLTCDLADGQELESDAKTYADNLFAVATVDVDDDKCNNMVDFARESALAWRKAMTDLKVVLNTNAISFLDANIQQNLFSDVASVDAGGGAWAVDGDGATILVPQIDLNNPDTLAYLDVLAQNNLLEDFFILSGWQNFYTSNYNADFKRLNDNERALIEQYRAHDVNFDVRSLDQTLGAASSFLINPSSFAYWNTAWSAVDPIQVDYDKWEFRLEDPVLKIRDNGTLRPVYYEVVYQKLCKNRDSKTRHRFTHRYEVKYIGGRDVAPAGVQSETGIVKIQGVAGL